MSTPATTPKRVLTAKQKQRAIDRQRTKRAKERRQRDQQQEANAARQAKQLELKHFRDVTRAIRQGKSAEAILAAIRGACDQVGNTEADPVDTLADAIWNTFCDVARLANEEDVPNATRLSFAQTLIHAAAVAEHRLAVETQQEIRGVVQNLNLGEAIKEDRHRVISEIRRAIEAGLITVDDIDPAPIDVSD